MILLIDNYDSFTWNLVQRLAECDRAIDLDRDMLVVRNDRITADEAEAIGGGRGPTHVIISPGPCTPSESGVSPEVLTRFAGRVPVLGVCLGHQCMGAIHGMNVKRHVIPVHGRTSEVLHDGKSIYAGLPSPFVAARYHSLIVDESTLPSPDADGSWVVSAWTDEPDEPEDNAAGVGAGAPARTRRVVMGLRRQWSDPSRALFEGVQYHPESFMTEHGLTLLRNFLDAGATPWR